MRTGTIVLLTSLLILGSIEGILASKSKKHPTATECNSKIDKIAFKCYEKGLKHRKCGTPKSKTTALYSTLCKTCIGCVRKAQECMLKELKKSSMSKCPQAQQSVIHLNRELKSH
ncbi:hypothetical protein D915_000758 [Fasciola hepatica]|uniref:Uncharacterized protein n=1 Tax=Fasciola hepatica TaxID=6192 RepID=A0A2H1CV20_FASHE|nr:hypothetical protein D915_000758 [Fasciola hepatica]